MEAKQLEGVADVRDESDRSGVRLVVEVKRGTSPQLVLAQLYKTTRLQQRFSANMVRARGCRKRAMQRSLVGSTCICVRLGQGGCGAAHAKEQHCRGGMNKY